VLTSDHTVLPATHTFIHEWFEPSCLYSEPQSIAALWPVLFSRPAEGRRLSWPGWPATYRCGMLAWIRSTIPVLNRLFVELLRWYSQRRYRKFKPPQ